MPNTNVQAVRISNEKIRPLADRLGQIYNLLKAVQAEAAAEGWLSMFPNDSEAIVDGSATDGRTPITNADVRSMLTGVGLGYITLLEQNSNAHLNNVLKIAVNPLQGL